MELELVYFAYPYTDNPKPNTKAILELVRRAIRVKPNIVPFVPHTSFDIIFEDEEGYTEEKENIGLWCFEIISKCDKFCYVKGKISKGVFWEKSFARRIGVPVVEYEELICLK